MTLKGCFDISYHRYDTPQLSKENCNRKGGDLSLLTNADFCAVFQWNIVWARTWKDEFEVLLPTIKDDIFKAYHCKHHSLHSDSELTNTSIKYSAIHILTKTPSQSTSFTTVSNPSNYVTDWGFYETLSSDIFTDAFDTNSTDYTTRMLSTFNTTTITTASTTAIITPTISIPTLTITTPTSTTTENIQGFQLEGLCQYPMEHVFILPNITSITVTYHKEIENGLDIHWEGLKSYDIEHYYICISASCAKIYNITEYYVRNVVTGKKLKLILTAVSKTDLTSSSSTSIFHIFIPGE